MVWLASVASFPSVLFCRHLAVANVLTSAGFVSSPFIFCGMLYWGFLFYSVLDISACSRGIIFSSSPLVSTKL